MAVRDDVIATLVSYLTGRGAELALPVEDHCANMADDLAAADLLVAE